MRRFFTSESVTEGHPDKICDQISDSVLDAILEKDPMARVACEVSCTTGLIVVMGEITTTAQIDIQKIARETVLEIGYDRAKYGFDGNTCGVLTALDKQSPDISMGVTSALEQKNGEVDEKFSTGAGDQGIIFGFACDETEELMPLPISLAHKLAKQLTLVRKNGTLSYLRPDGKTQVQIRSEYERAMLEHAIVEHYKLVTGYDINPESIGLRSMTTAVDDEKNPGGRVTKNEKPLTRAGDDLGSGSRTVTE